MMDEKRNSRHHRRRNTVCGPSPSVAGVARYQTLEDYRRPAKEFEQLFMEERKRFMEVMDDEPLSVRSYSPDRMSVASSVISSASLPAFLPNIGKRRSKSFSGPQQPHHSENSNKKSLAPSSSNSSIEDHDSNDYRNNCRRSSASSAPSHSCLLYTSPSPRDGLLSRMPSSA